MDDTDIHEGVALSPVFKRGPRVWVLSWDYLLPTYMKLTFVDKLTGTSDKKHTSPIIYRYIVNICYDKIVCVP